MAKKANPKTSAPASSPQAPKALRPPKPPAKPRIQAPEGVKLHQWATWPDELVHRSQINPAPYNPRFMPKENRELLDEGLDEHGAVQPLVWNRRTGNLVGGHQRLTYYDRKAYPSLDYSLTVVVVDVDEQQEMTMNLSLNNAYAQGTWNVDLLGAALKKTGLKGTGFNAKNVRMHVSPNDCADIFGSHVEEASVVPVAIAQSSASPSHQLVTTIVFQTRAHCDQFSTVLGFDTNDRYIDGKRFLAVVEALITKKDSAKGMQ